jgi:ABC-type dipeptide/oligopeptide/nickel transport system permease component
VLPYILRRLLHSIPVVLICSVLIFVGLRLAPGDPALLLAGPDPSPETVEAIRQRIGLDKSMFEQYAIWIGGLVQGDLGLSLANGRPVAELVGRALLVSLPLALLSLALTLVLGGLLGIYSALHTGGVIDAVVSGLTSLAQSVPLFWTGIALIMLFAVQLRVLPVGAPAPPDAGPVTGLVHMLLPAFTLAIGNMPTVIRFLQSGIREAIHAEHVTTARAKGLPGAVVLRDYVLRNSLLPVITASGLILGNLIGGIALVEIVFSWPGIGSLLVNAMANRDYGVVQAAILVAVAGFILSNLLVDVLCAFIDPRVRAAQNA